uniref:gluconeogenesis factor YvcK family protein n=1 Tax=Desulforadius tongensis TaxID=1216062 RepID=UPI001A9C4EF7|nr:YvcK family protein [Desulforadius tongensis]
MLKWLYPGMGIKRWIILGWAGTMLIALGIGFFYPRLFYSISKAATMLAETRVGIANWLAGFVIFTAGLITAGYALLKAFGLVVGELSPSRERSVVDVIYAKRYLQYGPKIVVMGGGTGLSTMLKGIKEYTSNITAVVTVTDDGGSSGRLRGDLGILPPGDIRNCLVALADKESLMERVLQYRFTGGEMAGHSLGNLFLVALSDLSGGFYSGIRALSKVLAIRGRVLPSTLQNVVMGAELSDGTVVRGESSVSGSGKKIRRIFLEPADCEPLPEVLTAIKEADAIVLGPGSLYTSVMPHLLMKGIPGAIRQSKAVKIYVCNVMTQPGETKNYTASDHLKAIEKHGGRLVDYVIVNSGRIPERLLRRYRSEGAAPVKADTRRLERMGVRPIRENLVLETDVVRHHPEKLARAILKIIFAAQSSSERVKFMKDCFKNEK